MTVMQSENCEQYLNASFVRKLFVVEEKKPYKKYIADAVEYIHSHFDKDISLKDLAGMSNKSQYHFTRMFKGAVGDSPYQYLIKYRLKKSKEMLAFSDKTVGEISYEVGFGSPSQFSCLFKRSEGMTPRQYRDSAWY